MKASKTIQTENDPRFLDNPPSLSHKIQSRLIRNLHLKYQDNICRMKKYGIYCRIVQFNRDHHLGVSPSLSKRMSFLSTLNTNFEKDKEKQQGSRTPRHIKKQKFSSYVNSELQSLSRTITHGKKLKSFTILLQNCEIISKQGFYHLARQLRTLKSLSDFKLKIMWGTMEPEDIRKLCRNLFVNRNLSTLSLTFQGDVFFSDMGFFWIFRNLESCQNLKSFALEIKESFQNISHKTITQLFIALSKISNLESLKLAFSKNKNIDKFFLDSFVRILPHFTRLSNLELVFQSCVNVKDQNLHQIATQLSILKELSSLYLDFGWCRFVNDSICTFSNSMRSLPKLKKLYLDFRECEEINMPILSTTLDNISVISTLTHLNITFGDKMDLTTEAFSSLGRLVQLKTLRIFFDNSRALSDYIITIFSESLAQMRDLESLSLIIHRGVNLTDQSVKSLTEAFPSLQKLKYFRFHLYMHVFISDETCLYLKNSLFYLKELETLNLNLSWNGITDSGIIDLGSVLKQLAKLKTLYLYFYACEKGDGGIGSIGKALPAMKELTSLKLDFGKGDFTEKGVKQFGNSISDLPCLTELDLSLSLCEKLRDKDIEQFCAQIKKLKSLRMLNLDFEGTCSSSFSKESIRSLRDNFPLLQSFGFRVTSDSEFL